MSLSSALALLVALAATVPTTRTATAPPPRALYPKFDLTYLPKMGGQGVIGIRPAEIAKYATTTEVKQATQLVQGFFCQILGGDPDAAEMPTFDNLEECVFCLDMRFTAPKDDEKASFMLGGRTPGMMRSVRPFDWDNLLRKWYPKATTAKHAGRSYLRFTIQPPIPLPMTSEEDLTMAAYLPDARTVVLGAESQIHTLLDRLEAGKPAPNAPPGWREVDRNLVAFALDNREVPLIHGKFPKDYTAAKEVEGLAGSMRTLAFGLSVGERTHLRFVVTARNAADAGKVIDGLKGIFQIAGDGFAGEKDPDQMTTFGLALMRSAALRQSGRRVTGSLSADGNVFKMLFAVLRGPA